MDGVELELVALSESSERFGVMNDHEFLRLTSDEGLNTSKGSFTWPS